MKLAFVLALTGCSNILGIEDLNGPSGPPDVRVDAVVEIFGTVKLVDSAQMNDQPVGGAHIEFVRMPDRQAIAETVSGNGGEFELALETGGAVLDGYLRIFQGGGLFLDTFCYPQPLTSSISFDTAVFSQNFIDGVGQQSGQLVNPNRAFVVALVIQPNSTTMAGRAGVRLTVPSGAQPVYAEVSGAPNPQLGQTTASGRAFLLNDDPDLHVITASANNLTVGEREIDGQPGTVHFVPIETN